jgi:predicted PurR-regulated permease PerM
MMNISRDNLHVLKLLFNTNVTTALTAFLSVVVLCVILHIAKDIFIPLVIAWFILQILKPVNILGRKLHLHPYLNFMLIFTVLIGVGFMGVRFMVSQAADFTRVYNRYAVTLRERYDSFMSLMNITPEMISGMNWTNIGFDFLKSSTSYVVKFIFQLTDKFFMTIFFLMFILAEAPYTDRKIDRAFSGRTGVKVKSVMKKISEQVSYYMINQTILSLATALFVWLVLAVMNVELSRGWAMLSFFLNFIPNAGSIIATILPVMMSLIQFPTLIEPLIVLALLTAIQMVIGNIIGPKILSESLGVSSIVILLSLLFWTMIWGIPGAFLSVPIASIIRIICENVPQLNSIAVLMGNAALLPDNKESEEDK